MLSRTRDGTVALGAVAHGLVWPRPGPRQAGQRGPPMPERPSSRHPVEPESAYVMPRAIVDTGAIVGWLMVWGLSIWFAVALADWLVLGPSDEERGVYRFVGLFTRGLMLSSIWFASRTCV